MKLRRAMLIGLDTWHLEGETPFSVCPLPGASAKSLYYPDNPNELEYTQIAAGKELDARLMLFRPCGREYVWSGTYGCCTNDRKVPDLWSNWVKSTYLRAVIRSEYLTWQGLVDLDPDEASSLIENNPDEGRYPYDRLFNAILPECAGEHVDVASYRPEARVATVLYLEPEEALPFNYKYQKGSNIRQVAQEVQAFLQQGGAVVQPHLLRHALLFHGIDGNSPVSSLVIVSLAPIAEPNQEDTVFLPRTVIDVASYMTITQLWGHFLKQLRQHPSLSLSGGQYKSGSSGPFEEQLRQDRTSALALRSRITAMADAFAKEIDRSDISIGPQIGESAWVETEVSDTVHYSRRYNVLDEIAYQLSRDQEAVHRDLERIEAQESLSADYLEDKTVAEAKGANTGLQKLISRFTRSAGS